jgi:hypothetical protein
VSWAYLIYDSLIRFTLSFFISSSTYEFKMSIRLPTTAFISESNNETEEVGSTSSEGEDDDQNWDDWASDSGLPACESLFEPKKLPSVTEALAYDKSTHGFDLSALCAHLCSSSRHHLHG